jgi:hypothetical protein
MTEEIKKMAMEKAKKIAKFYDNGGVVSNDRYAIVLQVPVVDESELKTPDNKFFYATMNPTRGIYTEGFRPVPVDTEEELGDPISFHRLPKSVKEDVMRVIVRFGFVLNDSIQPFKY